MALSGSFKVGTSNQYIEGQLEWSATQDIANNRSTISFTLWFYRLNAVGTFGSSGTWTVTVNGVATTATHSYNYPSSQAWVSVLTGSVVVPHNADGKKQVTIEVDGNTDTHDVYYANSSPWLDDIPRASTFNGGIDWVAGIDNFTISIDRKSTAFTHKVEMFVQNPSNVWDYIGVRYGVATTGLWNPTVAEITAIYTSISAWENRPMRIRVHTFNGETQIGTYQDKIGIVKAYATGKPSFNDFNIGTTTIPATIVNYNAAFTYDAIFEFGTFTKTFTNVSASFNMTLTAGEVNSMYQNCTDALSKQGKVTVYTKYNGVRTENGDPDPNFKTFIATVVNSNPTFSTIQYADTNSAMTTLTANSQYIIQNKSTVQAKILNANKAVGKNYATITKYVATLNGVTLTVVPPFATDIIFDFGVVNSALHVNLQITAYDSRGLTTVVTKQVTMVPYTAPVANTQALRDNGFGSNVSLTLSGSIAPVNINGVDKNSLVPAGVNYKWRQGTGAWSSLIQFLGQTITMPNYTTTGVSLTMDTTLAFEIVVTVTDKLNTVTTVTLNVPVGIPILFIDYILKSVGVGKFPTGSNTFETAGAFEAGGAINMNGNGINEANHIKFNDIGVNEGLEWVDATNNWKVYVSPDALTNATGDLQIVHNNVRKATFRSNGDLEIMGSFKENGSPVTPVGSMSMYGGITAPSGWLLCQGQAVSRTTYADLYAAISTRYGVGDNTTTFNLPDMRGRIPVGLDSTQTEFDTMGEKGGAKTHTLAETEMPAHSHGFSHSQVGASGTATWTIGGSTGTTKTHVVGGGAAHNNLQPYIVTNYIIKI